MPRIVADERMINTAELVARKVFGKDGILPLPAGSTEVFPGIEGEITIFLHRKTERSPIILHQIYEAFNNEVKKYGIRTRIVPSDEKQWRKF